MEIKPVYTEFRGWQQDVSDIRRYDDLPLEFKQYVQYIEKELNVPISVVSVGPDREATIVR